MTKLFKFEGSCMCVVALLISKAHHCDCMQAKHLLLLSLSDSCQGILPVAALSKVRILVTKHSTTCLAEVPTDRERCSLCCLDTPVREPVLLCVQLCGCPGRVGDDARGSASFCWHCSSLGCACCLSFTAAKPSPHLLPLSKASSYQRTGPSWPLSAASVKQIADYQQQYRQRDN